MCTSESEKTIICVLYSPPECPVPSFETCLDFIDQYIASGDGEYQLSLLGDFDIPLIGWSTNSILPGGSESLCTQHVLEPTRLRNVLDLYISNSEDLVSHVSISDTSLSDHRRVEIFLSYNPSAVFSEKEVQ